MKLRSRTKLTRREMFNLFFLLPLLSINITFFLFPFLKSLYMSLFNWKLLGNKEFIGLANYIKAFTDKKFLHSLIFTFKYAIIVTPALFIVAFIMAILVNKNIRGVGIFRTIYFLPVVISMTASADIWLWIYNEIYGVLNHVLLLLGIIEQPIAWMHKPEVSLPAVCFMVTWKMAGFSMLMLLGAFQSIDDEIYQAADIDGANAIQRFFRITFPLIRPTLGLSLIISVIGSVLAFEQFVIMTKGGPSSQTMTAVHYIYTTSFKHFKFGYGAAMSMILLVILAILSYFQAAVTRDATE